MMKNTTHVRAGFTLPEVAIVLALLGLVIGTIALVSSSGTRAFQTSSTKSHLEAQAVTALDRAVVDMRIAVADSLAPSLDPGDLSEAVEYVQAIGFTGSTIDLSGVRRLAFDYELGEIDDGIDNNGNGLVDEGRLTLTEDVGTPDERTRVLTRWVREYLEGEEPNGIDDNGNGLIDEPGFCLQRSGETLTVWLTLERLDQEHRALARTARSSTKLRN